MQIIVFKTNIYNEWAAGKVVPFLDEAVGSVNWQLDIRSGGRKLTVYASGIVNEDLVLATVQKAGFKAINLEDYYSIF